MWCDIKGHVGTLNIIKGLHQNCLFFYPLRDTHRTDPRKLSHYFFINVAKGDRKIRI